MLERGRLSLLRIPRPRLPLLFALVAVTITVAGASAVVAPPAFAAKLDRGQPVAGVAGRSPSVRSIAEDAGSWSSRFDTLAPVGPPLVAMGNDLVGGQFRWDGTHWSRLGEYLGAYISAAVSHGSDLYVAGWFFSGTGFVARWDGAAWSFLAQDLDPRDLSLAMLGDDLIVGGFFEAIDGKAARHVARWNGQEWSAFGAGPSDVVRTLAVAGNTLYAAGGWQRGFVAKWNGTFWSDVGGGLDSIVVTLLTSGKDLYVGGYFLKAGSGSTAVSARHVVKWNGSKWTALGSGVGTSQPFSGGGNTVSAMTMFGNDLVVGGSFRQAGSITTSYIAKWNGKTWSALAEGAGSVVTSLAVVGDDLHVSGIFDTAGGAAIGGVARWNGRTWSPLGDSVTGVTDVWGTIEVFAVHENDLYAGGRFQALGGARASRVAKWDGVSWSALGGGMDGDVRALAVAGDDIYAGGDFFMADGKGAKGVARWDGQAWSSMGSGLDGHVLAMAVAGTTVYAAGGFDADQSYRGFLARWDGDHWSLLGGGTNGRIDNLAVLGDVVIAGGDFSMAGEVPAARVTAWNGSEWSALGDGLNSGIYDFAVIGSDLYAVGNFFLSGTTSVDHIAKWDGQTWKSVGGGSPGSPFAIEALGSDLYVFTGFVAGEVTIRGLAKWDGSQWSVIPKNGYASEMAALGSHLYMTGYFPQEETDPLNIAMYNTGACGNGVVDPDEDCDPEIDGTGNCCNLTTCRLAPQGTTCRPARGPCDVAESCDGVASICPVDEIAAAGNVCRESTTACDPAETCDGDGVSCPAETSLCDDADVCTGTEICLTGGICQSGTDLDCYDRDECTDDLCGSILGCYHELSAAEDCPKCGDVDMNGFVTAGDALIALRSAVRLATCRSFLCDLNDSGDVTVADALAVLRMSVGLPVDASCPLLIDYGPRIRPDPTTSTT